MNILFVHSSLDDWDLTPQAFRVAGHIARRTDGGKSTQKMPGRESMMRVTRLTKEKLTDALAELEYCGILGIDRRDGKVNRYTLLPQSRWRRKVPGDEWKYTTSLRKKREKAGLPCDDEGGTNQGGNPTGLEIQPGRKSNPGPGRKNVKNQGGFPATKVIQEGNPRKELPEGSIDPPAEQPVSDTSETPPEPAEKKPARRNLAFDALAELDGVAGQMTPSAGGRIGKALSEIRGAWPRKLAPKSKPAERDTYEAELAEEIKRRARVYREELFPRATITSTALASWWAKCAPPPSQSPTAVPLEKQGRFPLPDGCDFRAVARRIGIRIDFDTPWPELSFETRGRILEAHSQEGLIS